MIHLEAERLVLRNVRPEDTLIMHDYRNNPICAQYQRGQTKDLPGIQKLTENRQNDSITDATPFFVAVALKDSDQMIGEIVVMPNDGCFSIGYTFHYAHHRKGYAFEALTLLVETLHQSYPEMEFISFTEPENMPSRRLLEKLGYTDLGYVEQVTSQMYGKYLKEE